MSISLRSDEEAKDYLSWGLTSSGHFSIKSAYASLRIGMGDSVDNIWKLIWCVKVPQWYRVFLWLVMHKKFITNVERVRRGFTQSEVCPVCHRCNETLLHLLRDCSLSMQIWKSFLGPSIWQTAQALDLNNWIRSNLQGMINNSSNSSWAA